MNSLFLRLFSTIALTIVLAILVSAILFDDEYKALLTEDHLKLSAEVYQLINWELTQNPQQIQHTLERWQNIFSYEIKLLSPETLTLDKSISEALAKQQIATEIKTGWIENDISLYYSLPEHQLILTLKNKKNLSSHYIILAIVWVITITFCLAAAAYVLVRPIVKHNFNLVETCEHYLAGKLDIEANEDTSPPFDQVTRTFNRMMRHIRKLIAEQNVLTNAVAHELRTPIARLRFALDLTRDAPNEAQLKQQIQELDEDLNQLEQLTSELLGYAHLSSEQSQLKISKFSVFDRLTPLLDKLQAECSKASIQLKGDNADLYADATLFERVVNNLVTNGLRYSKKHVDIHIKQTPNGVLITVDDDGPGIPLDQATKLLKPFSRADTSRSRDTGGFGLGLAYVNVILEKHGGRISFSTSPWNGARIELHWPNNTPRI